MGSRLARRRGPWRRENNGRRGRLRRRFARSSPGDDGAAVVEFVMISVLLVLLLFGVLQVAAYFYVRNVVSASVADGARYAAGADVDVAAGGPRASLLIGRGLSPSVAADLPCSSGTQIASGLVVTRVECQGRIRSILLPVGRFVSVDVVAHAVRER